MTTFNLNMKLKQALYKCKHLVETVWEEDTKKELQCISTEGVGTGCFARIS
jgi:hypothetical protein